MIEQGKVVKTRGDAATVKIDKKDECSKCGMCLFPKNASSIDIEADNGIGATEGQTVIIETSDEIKLIGIFLAFIVPLLLIGVAVAVTYFIIGTEIWMLVLSVIFVVLWYTILAFIDKKFKTLKRFSAKIIKIKENETNE